MPLKYHTQYITKFGKLSSGHRTGKGQLSFQSQRKAMPKIAQISQNCAISHASNAQNCQTRLQQYVNHNLTDVQAGFRKGRGTRDQIEQQSLDMRSPGKFSHVILLLVHQVQLPTP